MLPSREMEERFRSIVGEHPREQKQYEFSGRVYDIDKKFINLIEQLDKFQKLDHYERIDRQGTKKALDEELQELKKETILIIKGIAAEDERIEKEKQKAIIEVKKILEGEEFAEINKKFVEVGDFIRKLLDLNNKHDLYVLRNAGAISCLMDKELLKNIVLDKKTLKLIGVEQVAGTLVDDIKNP